MNKQTFFDTEDSLNEDDISKFERKYNLNLPIEYRKHLLSFNGGYCEPSCFYFKDRNIAYRLLSAFQPLTSTSHIHYFFAIKANCVYDLEEEIQTFKINNKRMPNRMLPIACDDGGNLICISCNGKDKGYVYFWDHEREEKYKEIEDDDDDVRNLHFIAKSFTLFLSSLFELKDE